MITHALRRCMLHQAARRLNQAAAVPRGVGIRVQLRLRSGSDLGHAGSLPPLERFQAADAGVEAHLALVVESLELLCVLVH